MDKVDITIIGAGAVGLAIAEKLTTTDRTVVVVEKNPRYGQETSSRNSEVIHAGIYYKPGTLKARLCMQGKELLYRYCKKNNIPYKRLGKLIVASNDDEIKKLYFLAERAKKNGVLDLQILDSAEISKLEPLIKAQKAILSPSTGIFSTDLFMDSLHKNSEAKGAMLLTETEVTGIAKEDGFYKITTYNQEPFLSKIVINAAGHNADAVASLAGIDIKKCSYTQKFVKGEYFRITKPCNVTHLIYPVPTEISLGTHLTPDMEGRIRIGPNAFDVKEIEYAVDENHRQEFLNSARKFLPDLRCEQIIPDTSGIRARLAFAEKDTPDFIINHEADKGLGGFVNLIGIESPGLTTSLAIAKYVEDLIQEVL